MLLMEDKSMELDMDVNLVGGQQFKVMILWLFLMKNKMKIRDEMER